MGAGRSVKATLPFSDSQSPEKERVGLIHLAIRQISSHTLFLAW